MFAVEVCQLFFVRGCKILCFSLIATLLCNITVLSAITLDPTFNGGKITISFPENSTSHSSVGLRIFAQPGGRIVAGGTFTNQGGDGQASGVAFVGLTNAGALDPTFGNSGFVTDWTAAGHTTFADAYMYPDGRILRASQVLTVFPPIVSKVVRMTSDGMGSSTFDVSVAGASNHTPVEVGVQSDGKIIVLEFAQSAATDFHLVRLNPDGTRDATFGPNGTMPMNFARLGNGTFSFFMEVLPDDRILLAGNVGQNIALAGFDEFFMMRLSASGHIDKSFGRQGVLRMAFRAGVRGVVNHLLMQPDGKILLSGGIYDPELDTWMRRFTPNGKADGTFGSAGAVVTDFAPGLPDSASAAAVSGDGKIRIAGQSGTPSSFLVARYSAGGMLEDQRLTAFTAGQSSGANDITIQPDGKLLVIGYTKNPDPAINGNAWALARYTE